MCIRDRGCVVWGEFFERDHFYDYQIVIPFHSTYTTWTIVVVFFFCLAISFFFAVRTFLHVLHISLLMCHCIYSAVQLSSCKCVFNKLSCQLSVAVSSNCSSTRHIPRRCMLRAASSIRFITSSASADADRGAPSLVRRSIKTATMCYWRLGATFIASRNVMRSAASPFICRLLRRCRFNLLPPRT